jgi:hypothetical protein
MLVKYQLLLVLIQLSARQYRLYMSSIYLAVTPFEPYPSPYSCLDVIWFAYGRFSTYIALLFAKVTVLLFEDPG